VLKIGLHFCDETLVAISPLACGQGQRPIELSGMLSCELAIERSSCAAIDCKIFFLPNPKFHLSSNPLEISDGTDVTSKTRKITRQPKIGQFTDTGRLFMDAKLSLGFEGRSISKSQLSNMKIIWF
jgi:hypothetical protein